MKATLPLLTSLVFVLSLIPSIGGAWARGNSPPPADPPPARGGGPVIRCKLVPETDEGVITALAFSPDGTTLAAGNMSGMVRYYDPATAVQRASFRVQELAKSGINCLAYAPDGKTLAATPFELGHAALLEPETGRPRLTMEMPPAPNRAWPYALAYAPDGKTVAAGGLSGEVALWDAATGRRRAILPAHIIPAHTMGPYNRPVLAEPAYVVGLAFSPDGATLVSASGFIRLWDVATGRERMPRIEAEGTGLPNFSPDGKTLALAYSNGDLFHPRHTVSLWDTAAWRKRAEAPVGEAVAGLAYLPSGRALVVLEGRKVVRLRDAADGRALAALEFEDHCVFSRLAISPDGKTIAVGGFESDPMFGVIGLIETDGKTLRPYEPRREPERP